MQYRFQTILKNAKLPSVHFHALRHIFASNCIKLGFDVKALSELLRHSSVEITLNRYVHSSFDQKREYMKRVQMSNPHTLQRKMAVKQKAAVEITPQPL